MSDYLSNLAARSLNLTEVIKPRLPALFEPPQGSSGIVGVLPLRTESETVPAAREDATPHTIPSDRLESAQSIAYPELEHTAEVPLHDANMRVLIAPSPGSPREIAPTSGRPVREYRGPQKPPVTDESEIAASFVSRDSYATPLLARLSSLDVSQPPWPAVKAAKGVEGPGGRDAQASRMALESALERSRELNEKRPGAGKQNIMIPPDQAARSEGSPCPTASTVDAQPRVTPHFEPAVPEPSEPLESLRPDAPPFKEAMQCAVIERTGMPEAIMSPVAARAEPPSRIARTIIAQPRMTPYVKPAVPASSEPLEALQPAPTIQVTIGRIEVRATPPSAPLQNRRPAPPVMSLGEYLNQRTREGGNR